jgi:hypothetical protein
VYCVEPLNLARLDKPLQIFQRVGLDELFPDISRLRLYIYAANPKARALITCRTTARAAEEIEKLHTTPSGFAHSSSAAFSKMYVLFPTRLQGISPLRIQP